MGQSVPVPGPPGPGGPPGKDGKGIKGDPGPPGTDGNVNIDNTNIQNVVTRLARNTDLTGNVTATMGADPAFLGQVVTAFSTDQLGKLANAMLTAGNTRFVNTVVNSLTGDFYDRLPKAQISDEDVNRRIKPRTLWCADGSSVCANSPTVQRNFFTGDVVIRDTNNFMFGTHDATTGQVSTRNAGMQFVQSNSGNWQSGPFVWGASGGSLGVSGQIAEPAGATVSWDNRDVFLHRGNLTVGDGTRGNITMRGSRFNINSAITQGSGGTAMSVDPSETLVLNEFGDFDSGVRVGGTGLDVSGNVRVGQSSGSLQVGMPGGPGGNIVQHGPDFIMRHTSRGTGGRALVHESGNVLAINYENDFAHTRIDSELRVAKNAFVGGNNIGFRLASGVTRGALTLDTNDRLAINFNKLFPGGTTVEGNLAVGDDIRVGNFETSTGNVNLVAGNLVMSRRNNVSTVTGGAMVLDRESNVLMINRSNAFEGGTEVQSDLKVSRRLNVLGGTTLDGELRVNSNLIRIQNNAAGGGGRALLHDAGNKLVVNSGGDFNGGTEVQSNLTVSGGNLTVSGNLIVNGMIQLGDWKIRRDTSDNGLIIEDTTTTATGTTGSRRIKLRRDGNTTMDLGSWNVHDSGESLGIRKGADEIFRFTTNATGHSINITGGWSLGTVNGGADFRVIRTNNTAAYLRINGGGNNDTLVGGKMVVNGTIYMPGNWRLDSDVDMKIHKTTQTNDNKDAFLQINGGGNNDTAVGGRFITGGDILSPFVRTRQLNIHSANDTTYSNTDNNLPNSPWQLTHIGGDFAVNKYGNTRIFRVGPSENGYALSSNRGIQLKAWNQDRCLDSESSTWQKCNWNHGGPNNWGRLYQLDISDKIIENS